MCIDLNPQSQPPPHPTPFLPGLLPTVAAGRPGGETTFPGLQMNYALLPDGPACPSARIFFDTLWMGARAAGGGVVC